MQKFTEHQIKVPQKFSIDQRVEVRGWTGSDFGTIEDIKPIFHHRAGEWVWGYKIKYEGKGAGLTFVFIPERYLRLPVTAGETTA